jgi:signal transduction histidine kinase
MTTPMANNPPEPSPPRRVVSIRGGLLLAFALVVLLVVGSLLTASLLGTKRMAGDVAGSLMFALGRDAEFRLHDLFEPPRQKVMEDYAAIRQGRYSVKDAQVRRELLIPGLFALPKVDSMMLADLKGGHFLILRYSDPVRRSALLSPVAERLPVSNPSRLQFLTREFRPAEWGETSHWALWEDAGRQLVQEWDLSLSSYDARQRPWYKAAMAAFRDQTLPEAQAVASSLVAWTAVYPLFTTKAPSISAAVAARDPSGEILIVTYNVALDEIAQFTRSVRPSPRGMLFVLTDDGRLLGPPRETLTDNQPDADVPALQPVAQSSSPHVADAVATWQADHGGQPDRFRLALDGETWWAGFTPFEIGSGRRFWIGVLLPESDLIPVASQNRWFIVGVGLLTLLIAAGLALSLARWFSKPLAELAAQSRRIASLDLTETAPVHSHLGELDLLSVALGEMRDALRRYIVERDLSRQEGHARKLEAVGQLAAGIAHEINTPAQYVGDGVHFLKEAFAGYQRLVVPYQRAVQVLATGGGQEALLSEIREVEEEIDLAYLDANVPGSFDSCQDGINRITTIVRAMKEFAHPDQSEMASADLNRALQTTLAVAKNEYKYVADVTTDFGDLPPVLCNVGDLNQVFLNLIVNAAHAIGDVVGKGGSKGTLRIKTCQEGDSARIDIADTGSGIPEAIRQRIFDPFFTTKEVGKGTGQGLAIARSIIVTKHHGSLTFESAVGKGTTFTIRLPIDDARALAKPESA